MFTSLTLQLDQDQTVTLGTYSSYSFAELVSDLGGFVFAVYLASSALVLLYTQISAQHELFSEVYSM